MKDETPESLHTSSFLIPTFPYSLAVMLAWMRWFSGDQLALI